MTESELQEYVEFANELPGGQRSAILRLVAEVERLSRNSERWEWVERNVTVPTWFSGCCVRTDNTMSMTECVDAAIAAEKRTE